MTSDQPLHERIVNYQTLQGVEMTKVKEPAARTFRQKVLHEIKVVGLVTLYFAFCFGILMLLKRLILAEYQIGFRGLSMALIGALVCAKVVVILEKVPLGSWIERHTAAVDVIVRTLLYTLGVFIAMLLEKGFESRHEAGGFGPGVMRVFHNRDVYHVWAGAIAVGGALLVFNAVSVLRKYLGHRGLRRLFFATPLEELEARPEPGWTKVQ